MTRKNILMFTFILLFLAMLQNVSAIGLRAQKINYNLEYEPGLESVFDYEFRTTSDTQNYKLYVRMEYGGDLTPYFNLSQNFFSNISEEELVPFKVYMKLPETPPPPGAYEVRVGVIETKASGGDVGAKTAAEAIFKILVLYPGKYTLTSMYPDYVPDNKTAKFEFMVSNVGTVDIDSVSASIQVYDAEGMLLGEISTEPKPVISNRQAKLYGSIDFSSMQPGEYHAKAQVTADDNITYLEKVFTVGSRTLEIIDYPRNLEKGAIQPFEITLKSKWNLPIEKVSTTIELGGETADTPTITLAPFKEGKQRGYINTKNIDLGMHEAKVTIHFEDQVLEKMLEVEIVKPVITESPTPTISLVQVIFALVIVLVCINVYLIIRRKKKG